MKSLYTWWAWVVLISVAFGGLFAVLVFAIVNVAGASLPLMSVIVAVLFLVFAWLHYFVWGRLIVSRQKPYDAAPQAPPTNILVEVSDRERSELIKVLEKSLAAKEESHDGEPAKGDSGRAALRGLLNRMRMFGA